MQQNCIIKNKKKFKTGIKSYVSAKSAKSHVFKSYNDMSTELGNNAKNNFQKRFFKLMKNVIFRTKYGKCEKPQRYQTCNN